MTERHHALITQLRRYIAQNGLQLLLEKPINHGQQFKLSNGLDTCVVDCYHTGNVKFGGKPTAFRQQVEEWFKATQTEVQGTSTTLRQEANLNRSTPYTVSPASFEKIRHSLEQVTSDIAWQGEKPENAQVYRAELRTGTDRAVITQYRNGTLLIQARASRLFDEICQVLDQNLTQPIADRATRFISEEQSSVTLAEMKQPGAEQAAWQWLDEQFSQPLLLFIDKHDRDTLISGAMLLRAAESLALSMPDYSPLVMPFARAYEGFLVKLFVHIGLGDAEQIKKDVRSIQVGNWLNQLGELIVDKPRHGHIISDLKTAWEGTRHLLIHSDPVRQMRIGSYSEAEHEICGVIRRAFIRSYHSFVAEPIGLNSPKARAQLATENTQPLPTKSKETKVNETFRIEQIDESKLLSWLAVAGHEVGYARKPDLPDKWQVICKSEKWRVFCPRDPGDLLIVAGDGRETFVKWYNAAKSQQTVEIDASPRFVAHIGADEAGKGDYYGPLVAAAVYVDGQTAQELVNAGVKDSKSLGDTKIQRLAAKIRVICPHVIKALKPLEYNEEYDRLQNLNVLLAELHATALQALVQQTNCKEVLVDQFANPNVLNEAVAKRGLQVELQQRTQGESDIAVAAASILARDSFVAAIEEYRSKSALDIPLGSSQPEVVEVGRHILKKWGQKGLRRIAKLHFRTTEEIERL